MEKNWPVDAYGNQIENGCRWADDVHAHVDVADYVGQSPTMAYLQSKHERSPN